MVSEDDFRFFLQTIAVCMMYGMVFFIYKQFIVVVVVVCCIVGTN